MPELPEVETVASTLRPIIADRAIRRVKVLHSDVVAGLEPGTFEAALSGASFEDVARRGKYLLLKLRSQRGEPLRLVLHLRMTGKLVCVPAGENLLKHTHLRFELDDGSELRFVDPRRFGRAYLLPGRQGAAGAGAGPEDNAAAAASRGDRASYTGCAGYGGYAEPPRGLVELGPEPLGAGFRQADMVRMLAGRRRQIKALLLDQSFLAGLGNIYTDESLFRAGIHPETRACDLTPREGRRLFRSIRRVLREAIGGGGTTIRDYVDGRGRRGEFAAYLRVYGHEGEPCPRCGTAIERHNVAGRSTYLCPRCQRPPGERQRLP